MEKQLLPSVGGAPVIVKQEHLPKQSWNNFNSNKTNEKEESMLDWKSLEFLGLVEEYVSAVIKGEKPEVSDDQDSAPAFPVAEDFSRDAAAAAAAASAVPPNPAPQVAPELPRTAKVAVSPLEKPKINNSNTLFVMKNCCPVAPGLTPPGTTVLPAAGLVAAGALGSSPPSALGGVAPAFYPLGTTFIASPISVDSNLQSVAITVTDDVSFLQPTIFAPAPFPQNVATSSCIGAAPAAPALYSQFGEERDLGSEELTYQLNYVVNEDLSRDGLSPNDSFESSSLNLSVGDLANDEPLENLNDVIMIEPQLEQESQQPGPSRPSQQQKPQLTRGVFDVVSSSQQQSLPRPPMSQPFSSTSGSPIVASVTSAASSASAPPKDQQQFQLQPRKPGGRRSIAKGVPEESLPFPCEVCTRRFVSLHSVKRHMAIHDLDRPWKCEVCGKAFKQQAHLYSHKFTHTGSKPFECAHCHKSFNVKSNLHRHEKEVCKVPLESRTPTRSK